jgi:hypothetical protein
MAKVEPRRSVPFHPWLPPPPGASGANWDGLIDFPREASEDRRADSMRRLEETARRKKEMESIQKESARGIVIAWHPWTVTAACLLAMAATSLGPARFLLPWFAAAVIPASAIAIYQLQNSNPFHKGMWIASGCAVLACVLLVAHFFL